MSAEYLNIDYRPGPGVLRKRSIPGLLNKGERNEPIQIIAFDLDGTVLDSKKHLSDRNRNTLAACAKMGIYVVSHYGTVGSRNYTGN